MMTPDYEPLPAFLPPEREDRKTAAQQVTGAQSRKPYQEPRLIIYGRLSDLTGAAGNDSFDGIIGSFQTT